ncbi:hypothetical protein ACFX16_030496 [Malus domestica]
MRVSYFLLFKRIVVEESISYYDSKFVFKCDKDMILYCLLHVVNEIGLWYGRHGASRRMVLECRTPLMVASKYGSVDVVKLILSLSKADVNFSLGPDKTTALHCAVSGGSEKAVETVKVLLQAGADPNATDANGCFPLDVIVAPLNCSNLKVVLQELLQYGGSVHALSVSFGFSSPFLSTTPTNNSLLSSIPDSTCNTYDIHGSSTPEKKEHPFDLSLPNIKDSIYATDEFRMFSFKIRPCSRAYSHDWTECPFVHPGENARRRDPRKFQYSCMPCLDFRKGTCRRGDLCECAHGVFECWLHPAQYKTRLCKDGMSCLRQAMSPPFTPPMSLHDGIFDSSMAWPQQYIPGLYLPGSNIQASRLRSSFNANNVPTDEVNMLHNFEMQQQQSFHDGSSFSHSYISASSMSHPRRQETLTPSNLDDVFASHLSSPRFADQLANSSAF